MQTNRRIGIAVGILMTRHRVSEDRSFAMLVEASHLSERKLRDIAEEVADEGDLRARTAAEATPWRRISTRRGDGVGSDEPR